jgi:hypothetical protein
LACAGIRATTAASAPPGPVGVCRPGFTRPVQHALHCRATARPWCALIHRFFTADGAMPSHRRQGRSPCRTGQLVGCADEIKQRIELLVITEIVLRDLQAQLEAGFSHDLPVPFYHVVRGKRVRELL